MASKVKVLSFPDWLLKTEYDIILNDEGISEEGAPIESLKINGKCIWSEKAKRIIDSEGKQITLLGKVIVKGDIAPSLRSVSDGVITINGNNYDIYAGYRPRNPNGTVHHTTFEVM